MFFLTFHLGKMTIQNWRIISLEDFMDSLNQAKGNKRAKDLKNQRVKEKKHSDVESSSSTDEDLKDNRMKSRRENPKCGY